jgi:hypothetical protein
MIGKFVLHIGKLLLAWSPIQSGWQTHDLDRD